MNVRESRPMDIRVGSRRRRGNYSLLDQYQGSHQKYLLEDFIAPPPGGSASPSIGTTAIGLAVAFAAFQAYYY